MIQGYVLELQRFNDYYDKKTIYLINNAIDYG